MSPHRICLLLGAVCVIFSACESPPAHLEEGRWVGTAMPVGHPDQRTDIYLRIGSDEQGWTILVGFEGEESHPARDIVLTADTLKFVFDAPGRDSERHCALGTRDNGSFEGLCSGSEGDSTYLTVRPPNPFEGQEA